MMKKANTLVTKVGMKICSAAVKAAAISPSCCRGMWYQPEEPK